MNNVIWFCYGFFTAMVVILLGIVGWGASMMMRLISYAPLGLTIVVGFVLAIAMVYWIIKPSEKKQISS